ncbi:MAG: MFS transporter, partial [Gemmataceae bacterium]
MPTPTDLSPVAFGTRATLLVASMMTVMAGGAVAAALPLFDAAFAEEPEHALLARLVLSLPALAIAVFAPLAGWVADRFGRRRLLVGGLVLYVLAGTTGVYLETPTTILIGRWFLGIAVAMIMTASSALVSDYFPPPERPRFLGLQAMFMSLGGVIFIPIGGLLSQFGWHA